MLKKAFFVIAGVTVLGVVMFGSNLMDLGRHLVGKAQDFGDSMVSVDTKIELCAKKITALKKDVKSLSYEIAKEEQACDELREEVVKRTTTLNELHAHMDILNTHLKENPSQVFVGTNKVTHTSNEVRLELASSLKQYKTKKLMLTALEKQLQSRETIVNTAKERLHETKRVQAEMMSELEALKAEHAMNKVAKINSSFKMDNSRLSTAKEALRKLKTDIRVEGKVLDQVETSGIQTKNIDTNNVDNITAQVDAYFGETSGVVKN